MKTSGIVFEAERSLVEPDELYDRSRYGHICTSKTPGSEPDWVQLPSGLWVMSFDGDDYIIVPDAASLDITTALSLEVWIKHSMVGDTHQYYLRKGAKYYFLHLQTTKNTKFGITTSAGEKACEIDDEDLVVDTWYHLVSVFTGSHMIIYKDGSVWKDTDLGATFVIETDNLDLYLGSDQHAGNNLYGNESGVRIYNYALSATQIRKIFDAEAPLFGV